MGDDVNDLPALRIAGLSVAPRNGHADVRRAVVRVTEQTGGNGAVRELLDALMSARPDR